MHKLNYKQDSIAYKKYPMIMIIKDIFLVKIVYTKH